MTTETLDTVIENIIQKNGPLKAKAIHEHILINDSYRKQDGNPVSVRQVNARISSYKQKFWRDKNHYVHIREV